MVFLAVFGLTHERILKWMVSRGGYFILFGLLFSCGLGMPLPEDIPLIASGIAVAQHQMHLWLVAPVAWCGIIGGDCILYYLGWRFGHNITKVPLIRGHITEARLHKAEKLFERWGIGVVFVGRMFAGIRGAMVVTAGTTRFHFAKFLLADGLGAVVSGGAFLGLGIWAGHHLGHVGGVIHRFRIAFMLGAVVLGLALTAYILWRNRRHKTDLEVVTKPAEGATPVAPAAAQMD